MKYRITEVVQVSPRRETEGGGREYYNDDSLINELSNAVAFQRLPAAARHTTDGDGTLLGTNRARFRARFRAVLANRKCKQNYANTNASTQTRPGDLPPFVISSVIKSH